MDQAHQAFAPSFDEAGCARLVDASGTRTAPGFRRLLDPDADPRDLSDALHALCALHGRHPGLVELAVHQEAPPVVAAWLTDAAEAFAVERTALAQLVAGVGPAPSTPNQAICEATLAGSARALDLLAQSGRRGCAIGAAMALVLEWRDIRSLMATAAARWAIDLAPTSVPDRLPEIPLDPAMLRAATFGADQLLAQHRGLWALLQTRAEARSGR